MEALKHFITIQVVAAYSLYSTQTSETDLLVISVHMKNKKAIKEKSSRTFDNSDTCATFRAIALGVVDIEPR